MYNIGATCLRVTSTTSCIGNEIFNGDRLSLVNYVYLGRSFGRQRSRRTIIQFDDKALISQSASVVRRTSITQRRTHIYNIYEAPSKFGVFTSLYFPSKFLHLQSLLSSEQPVRSIGGFAGEPAAKVCSRCIVHHYRQYH